MNKVKKIWSDPVWSKVIASGIIALLAYISTLIFPKFDKLIGNIFKYISENPFVLSTIILLFILVYLILKRPKHNLSPGVIQPIKLDPPKIEKIEEIILTYLARENPRNPEAGNIASALRISHTKCEYHLDKLLTNNLIHEIHIIGGSRYCLNSFGRKYVVEHKLL